MKRQMQCVTFWGNSLKNLIKSHSMLFLYSRYESILPETSPLVSGEDISYQEHLQIAYSQFQRLEIAVEFIIAQQLEHIPLSSQVRTAAQFDFLPPVMIWRHIQRELQKIILNLHTELVGQGATPAEPVPRAAIPNHVRCMDHAVYRDLRDFYVMKTIHKVSQFYKSFFSQNV